MSPDLIIEKGTHLRRTHFFLVASTLLTISLPLGYQNPTTEAALSEVQELSTVADFLKVPENASFSLVKEKWNNVHPKPTDDTGVVVTRDGTRPPQDEDLFSSSGPAVNGDLSDCADWTTVTRSSYDDFDISALPQAIECTWIGEDSVLYRRLEPRPIDEYSVATPTGLRPPTVAEHGRAATTMAPTEQLGECTDWADVSRFEFADISVHVDAYPSEENSIGCQWLGENSLLLGPPTIPAEERFVITPSGIEAIDRSIVPPSQTDRPIGRQLEQCAAWDSVNVADYSDFLSQLDSHISAEQAIFCRWLDRSSLLVYEIDWNLESNRDIPQQVRDVAGADFEIAFPNLSQLEYSADGFGEWNGKTVAAVEQQLHENRLEFDELSVIGISMNRNLLLYGAGPLICIIQLYFLLHFRQVNSRDLEGFPWIGTYPDWQSRAVFGISVALLAPTALWLLTLTQAEEEMGFTLLVAIASTGLATWQSFVLYRFWGIHQHQADVIEQ